MSGHVKHRHELRARALLANALEHIRGPSLNRTAQFIDQVLQMDRDDRDALPGQAVKKVKAAAKSLVQDQSRAEGLIREARAIMGKGRE